MPISDRKAPGPLPLLTSSQLESTCLCTGLLADHAVLPCLPAIWQVFDFFAGSLVRAAFDQNIKSRNKKY